MPGVILELPYDIEGDARRALRRAAYRAAARALRDVLGYPGAALALEMYAEELRTIEVDDGETTVVDIPMPRPFGDLPLPHTYPTAT